MLNNPKYPFNFNSIFVEITDNESLNYYIKLLIKHSRYIINLFI